MSFAVESSIHLSVLFEKTTCIFSCTIDTTLVWDLNAKLLTLIIISVDQHMIVCVAVHCTFCISSVLLRLRICFPACINSPADCPGSYNDEADALLKDYQSLSSYC